jgi:hypothetical protein
VFVVGWLSVMFVSYHETTRRHNLEDLELEKVSIGMTGLNILTWNMKELRAK